MQRSFEECKEEFLIARRSENWNDLIFWSTELLKYSEAHPWVWANRGEAIGKLGYSIDAILNYDKALSFEQPDENRAILYSNKGAAYWDMYNTSKSLENLKKAIEIKPIAQTYLTMGNIHRYEHRLDSAVECYRKCTELDPSYADGHLVLAMALLKMGQFEEGWKEYEWRFQSNQLPSRKLSMPEWKGEDLDNKFIFVYGEQGLGDIIQFSRYIRVLHKKWPKAKIIVEVRPQVHRLIDSINEAYSIIDIGDVIPKADYAIPMVSLAAQLTPTMADIPPATNEFCILNYHKDIWYRKLHAIDIPGVKVGLCWAGMARTHQPGALAIDNLRSTFLHSFAPLAEVPGILWVSLQKGSPLEQIKTPPRGMTIVDFNDDLLDFYDTAALIKNLDLVITVDTAVAHVAASIGKPTWMLSRWDGCWRWFGDREDSPWYPTLRQFVQDKPRDWTGVMQKVKVELNKFVQDSHLTLAK